MICIADIEAAYLWREGIVGLRDVKEFEIAIEFSFFLSLGLALIGENEYYPVR
jgi:hypothetical protein